MMEHIVSVLSSLVKQSLNLFANPTKQVKKMASINALVAMWPELGHTPHNPRGFIRLDGGYVILGPKDDKPYELSSNEQLAIARFLGPEAPMTKPDGEGCSS
jgi:hypothetical protein